MGSARKYTKSKHPPQLRSRTTRSSKHRLLDSTSPALSGALLSDQLRALGLYAANTLGDGNCLFRALSDQLYGSPSRHFELRGQICNWIEHHRDRYEPFVEDERGLETHLQCMRENGTYGGHMELSAFSHMTRRNVKVIQPGLVYVIEWAAFSSSASARTSYSQGDYESEDEGRPGKGSEDEDEGDPGLNDRERRRLHRDRVREKDNAKGKGKLKKGRAAPAKKALSPVDFEHDEDDPEGDTIYVAYHDWEHFSSIRNLRGPHTGLPCIQETPPSYSSHIPSPPSPARKPSTEKGKAALKLGSAAPVTITPSPTPSRAASIPPPTRDLEGVNPTTIPLPSSHSASPLPPPPVSTSKPGILMPHPLRASFLPPTQQQPSAHVSALTPASIPALFVSHTETPPYVSSSKRSFADSSGECEDSDACSSSSKRSRRSNKSPTHGLSAGPGVLDPNSHAQTKIEFADADPPALSNSVSTSSSPMSSISSNSSSGASSPEPEPNTNRAIDHELPRRLGKGRVSGERPLTRRERKRCGLPKQKGFVAGACSGRIVIPGGKFKPTVMKVEEEDGVGVEEWRRNGTGRVDVRGFRELRI